MTHFYSLPTDFCREAGPLARLLSLLHTSTRRATRGTAAYGDEWLCYVWVI